jgi:uncharacterized protein YlzI (FlbEa/FlbD family)
MIHLLTLTQLDEQPVAIIVSSLSSLEQNTEAEGTVVLMNNGSRYVVKESIVDIVTELYGQNLKI